jgi:hypothetical protein
MLVDIVRTATDAVTVERIFGEPVERGGLGTSGRPVGAFRTAAPTTSRPARTWAP